jgi:membrane protein YqaA with SNARE-associated domain
MKQLLASLLSWGPPGLLILAIVESLGIPNPGGTDIALIAIAAAQPQSAALAAALAGLGSLIGSTVFFEINRRGGEALLSRYTKSGRGKRLRIWYHHYGLVTVFISALVPIPFLPFKLFAACAGALGVPRKYFIAVLILARIPRYAGLAYLGTQLGPDSWPWIRAHVLHLTVIAILLFVVLFMLVRWVERTRIGKATATA